MPNDTRKSPTSTGNRRDFLKKLAAAGALTCFDGKIPLFRGLGGISRPQAADFDFKFRTVAIRHLDDMKKWMDKLDRAGSISRQATFRTYIGGFRFEAPAELPDARSIIVLARPLPVVDAAFHIEGRRIKVPIPSGYADDGITSAAVKERLMKDVIGSPGWKLEQSKVPMKQLAVRSGLAVYGRNNVTYVEGYGSYHQLQAYFTDYVFPHDHWRRPVMMSECRRCSLCRHKCPTQAIREKPFVIDAGRCLSLYNELPDPFPGWIDPRSHHALVGCLKCQEPCPVNAGLSADIETIAELDERETDFVLKGSPAPEWHKAIIAKFKRFSAVEDLAYFSRNLRLALNNLSGTTVRQ